MDSLGWTSAQAADATGYPGLLTIDLGALRRNYEQLCALAAPAEVAAVVKANAYGLGVAPVARTLLAAGCRQFFVAQLGEALALRPLLPEAARLYVLNGLLPGTASIFAAHNLIPVLNAPEQLEAWQAQARACGRRLPAILQFDTGMSRFGVAPQARASFRAALAAAPEIEALYVMSHLASADEPDAAQNASQRAEMLKIAAEFAPLPVCFGNSGGVLMGTDFHGALVRPGIAIYGGAPHAGRVGPMAPVVGLSLSVAQIREVPEGALIGYSATYRAAAPMRLAVLAAGYADGLPRALSGRGAAYYGGIRLPMVGRLSMDSLIVDITHLPEGALAPGDLVEMIGPHQSLEQLAADAGTISYEILTSLGQRYRRVYL